MAKTYTNYKIISDDDKVTFEASVENHLRAGWELYGDLQVTFRKIGNTLVYSQALIKS